MKNILIIAALLTSGAAVAQQPDMPPPAGSADIAQPATPPIQPPAAEPTADPMEVPATGQLDATLGTQPPTSQADPFAPPTPATPPVEAAPAEPAPSANQSWNTSAPVAAPVETAEAARPDTQDYPRCTRQVTDRCVQRGGR